MFKKLLLSLILFIFLTVSALGCILPAGTKVWQFAPGGVIRVAPINDTKVSLHKLQPSQEQLHIFSNQKSVNEDWSDAVIVTDGRGINILVHEGDLNCE